MAATKLAIMWCNIIDASPIKVAVKQRRVYVEKKIRTVSLTVKFCFERINIASKNVAIYRMTAIKEERD